MVSTTVQSTYTLEQAENDIATLRGQLDRLNEVLQLSNGPTPNTPASGTADLFASNGQIGYINASGLQMGLSGAQAATFPGTTVTQATLNTLASATYPGNDADAGAVYELEVNGNGTQGSTAQSLQVATVFGGNTMATFTWGSGFVPASQAFRWKVTIRVFCHTTGSGGTWSSEITGVADQFGTNITNSVAAVSCESSGTTAVSTTSNQTLALQAAWGSTTGAPTLTSRVALFKRIA
jgi:hypothetical protein